MPPISAKGTFNKISSACLIRFERVEQQNKDQKHTDRHNHRKAFHGALLIFKFAAPGDKVAWRHLDFPHRACISATRCPYRAP